MIRERMAIKFSPIRFTPMRITPLVPQPHLGEPRPLEPRPLGERRMAIGRPIREEQQRGPEILPDSGGQPPCLPEDLKRFKRDWHGIVPVVAMSHLRRHKEDILHGARSLNMLLPTKRETKDFDIYSSHPRPTASQLEASIDRKIGCDICETGFSKIPESALLQRKAEGGPAMSDELYRIRTKTKTSFLKKEPEMDIMKKPPGLKTISQSGITHESLEDAYAKLQYLKSQPSRGMKIRQDMRRVEEYLLSQGKVLPPDSLTERTSIAIKPRRMIL